MSCKLKNWIVNQAREYCSSTFVIPEKSLLHKYYSHPGASLGRLAMGLIELQQLRNGDLPWIWNCKIWKDDRRKRAK